MCTLYDADASRNARISRAQQPSYSAQHLVHAGALLRVQPQHVFDQVKERLREGRDQRRPREGDGIQHLQIAMADNEGEKAT